MLARSPSHLAKSPQAHTHTLTNTHTSQSHALWNRFDVNRYWATLFQALFGGLSLPTDTTVVADKKLLQRFQAEKLCLLLKGETPVVAEQEARQALSPGQGLGAAWPSCPPPRPDNLTHQKVAFIAALLDRKRQEDATAFSKDIATKAEKTLDAVVEFEAFATLLKNGVVPPNGGNVMDRFVAALDVLDTSVKGYHLANTKGGWSSFLKGILDKDIALSDTTSPSDLKTAFTKTNKHIASFWYLSASLDSIWDDHGREWLPAFKDVFFQIKDHLRAPFYLMSNAEKTAGPRRDRRSKYSVENRQSGGGASTSAPPPPPPPPQPTKAFHAPLLAIHNAVRELTRAVVLAPSYVRGVDKDKLFELPDFGFTDDLPSIVLHRACLRRDLLIKSRSVLAAHQRTNYCSSELARFRRALDDGDPFVRLLGQNQGTTKALHLKDYVLPASVAENLMPVVKGVDDVRRSARRWGWLGEFLVHDARHNASYGKKLVDYLNAITSIRGQRRIRMPDARGEHHRSMSVLPSVAAKGRLLEHVEVELHTRDSIDYSAFILDRDLLVRVGANTMSDRLFLAGAALTENDLQVTLGHTEPSGAWKKFVDLGATLRERTTRMRMGAALHKQFGRHVACFKVVADAARIWHLSARGNATVASSRGSSIGDHVKRATNLYNYTTTNVDGFIDELGLTEFGDPTSAMKIDGGVPNLNFLHFFDVFESEQPEQSFCAYTFTDWWTHFADVARRVGSLRRGQTGTDYGGVGNAAPWRAEHPRSSAAAVRVCDEMLADAATQVVAFAALRAFVVAVVNGQTSTTSHPRLYAAAARASDLLATPPEGARALLDELMVRDGQVRTWATHVHGLRSEARFVHAAGLKLYENGSGGAQQFENLDALEIDQLPRKPAEPSGITALAHSTEDNDVGVETGDLSDVLDLASDTKSIFNSLPSPMRAFHATALARMALEPHGILHADARHEDKNERNWNDLTPPNANSDFGILKLYESSGMTHSVGRYIRDNLASNLQVLGSIDRLPTEVEIRGEFREASLDVSDALDGTENRFMVNYSTRRVVRDILEKLDTFGLILRDAQHALSMSEVDHARAKEVDRVDREAIDADASYYGPDLAPDLAVWALVQAAAKKAVDVRKRVNAAASGVRCDLFPEQEDSKNVNQDTSSSTDDTVDHATEQMAGELEKVLRDIRRRTWKRWQTKAKYGASMELDAPLRAAMLLRGVVALAEES